MTMRIRTTDTLGGQPIIDVRKLLRCTLYYRGIDARAAETELHIGRAAANRLVDALLSDGYLEPNPDAGRHDATYRPTRLGMRLASATAAPAITRATADRLLAGVLERVREIEAPVSEFAYGIQRFIVFGSYLSESPRLNDLDLAVELVPRFQDPDEQFRYKEQRAHLWMEQGHVFSNIVDEYSWGEREVLRYLRGRHSAISLHDLTLNKEEQAFVARVPHRVLYER